MAKNRTNDLPITDLQHHDHWTTYQKGGVLYVYGDLDEVAELIRVMGREARKAYDAENYAIEVKALLAMLEGVDLWLATNRAKAYSCMSFRAWLARQVILQDPKRIARIRNEQLIELQEFEFLYEPGMSVSVVGPSGVFGGTLESVEFVSSMFFSYWQLQVSVIKANQNGAVGVALETVRVEPWEGQRHASTLTVRPLTPEDRETLTARGALFAKYAIGTQYLQYTGTLYAPSWYSSRRFRGDGRVMIDSASLEHFEPDLAEQFFEGAGRHRLLHKKDDAAKFTLKEEDYWRTWPQVPAFSFPLKRWGYVDVAGLAPIQFRSDAFDLLVLDPEVKRLVYSLVKYSGDSFGDLIDGKSGGCIFLLHGDPGVGKTLTAEAVAETLERPLYAVSVGELGTDPGHLEEALRKILDMASRWNAVLLLDEADIFLEARTQHDILRNAMVGVFLRLLEYHTGVLFLTTNRVRNFDPAFHSRISAALHYPSLTTDTRRKVVKNIFGKAGVADVDIEHLIEEPLNGRQLTNTLRIAQTLARADDTALTEEHLERVVTLARQFQTFLEGAETT